MKAWMKGRVWQIIFLTFIFAFAVSITPAQALDFKAWADINYADLSKDAPDKFGGSNSDKIASFKLGQLSLHAHGDLGENLDATTEIAFSSGSSPTIARLYVAYTFDELLKIRAGKWHKPIGYWNTTFHHGALLKTTIDSPLTQSLVPIHETGLWALGTYNSDPLRLDYGFSVTNGDRINGSSSSTNDTSDNNNNKPILFHMRAHPSAIPALGIGISGILDKMQIFKTSSDTVPTGQVSQQIYVVDLEYINQQIELLSEYFYFNDKDELQGKGTNKSEGSYIQLGYTIANRFMPYARFEKLSLREKDPYFTALSGTPDQQKTLVGLRYNMSSNSALKGEVSFIDLTKPSSDNYWKYAVQWAFAF